MNYTEYILPELLLVIPVLWVLGWLLKQAEFVDNKWIPLILGAAGIILSVFWIAGEAEHFGLTALFTSVTQGILCAGFAVYGNQLVKQLKTEKAKMEERADD